MNKPRIVPVLDDRNLVRDTQTKALLATNRTMLEEHRQKKKFLSNLANQSEEIERLRSDMDEIKALLRALVQDK